jgi:hypothetical protein
MQHSQFSDGRDRTEKVLSDSETPIRQHECKASIHSGLTWSMASVLGHGYSRPCVQFLGNELSTLLLTQKGPCPASSRGLSRPATSCVTALTAWVLAKASNPRIPPRVHGRSS